MQQILSLLGADAFITELLTSMGGYYAVLFTAMAIVFAVNEKLKHVFGL